MDTLIEALEEPEPLWTMPGVSPDYLRRLLQAVRGREKVEIGEVLQFTPGVGLTEIGASGLVWRAGDGRLEEWLRQQHDEIQPGGGAAWRLLWVYAEPEMVRAVSPLLASLCQRIRALDARCRVVVIGEVEGALLLPWARRVDLPPPRLGEGPGEGREGLEAYVREILSGPMPVLSRDKTSVDEIARKLQGLDADRVGSVLTRAVRRADRKPDIDAQRRELEQHIEEGRRDAMQEVGGLQVYALRHTANDVGGMEELKHYIEVVGCAFHDRVEAEQQRVKLPRGVLLVGMPGCGKSLAAELTADLLDMPLLRLDGGGLMGGLLGQSEHRLEQAIAAAEAAAPCVLWVDEIEKAIGGLSGSNEGGTGKRMLGRLLTWMQEQEAGVYLFATANRLAGLPPELLRRGRFDELWRVDLPLPHERQSILKIHLDRHGLTGWSTEDLKRAASDEVMKDYSGADIDALVREAHLRAFADRKEKITAEDLKAVAAGMTPLVRQFKDEIPEMRKKLENHGFRNVSSAENAPPRPALSRVRPRRLPPELQRLMDEEVSEFAWNDDIRLFVYGKNLKRFELKNIKTNQIDKDGICHVDKSNICFYQHGKEIIKLRYENNNFKFKYIKNNFTISGKPITLTTTTVRVAGITMIEIPLNDGFWMGSSGAEVVGQSDEKKHYVRLTRRYAMADALVTQKLYQAVMGMNPSHFKGDQLPVEQVSWERAVEFCNQLSGKDGLQRCYRPGAGMLQCDFSADGYRLPTEAEWEYAARANDIYQYSGGGKVEEVAWYKGNSGGATQPICQKRRNAFGLYDMSGNVWEWCWDVYAEYPSSTVAQPAVDPAGPAADSFRTLRGGSWCDEPRFLRVVRRFWNSPQHANSRLGFRIVRSIS